MNKWGHMMKRILWVLILFFGWGWVSGAALAQGDFYVIPVARGVGTAISSLPYEITQPGLYYLTKDLALAGNGHGITVKNDHVTLDLMGFSIVGSTGSVHGIYMNGVGNVEIRNGTIRSFKGDGIHSEYHANYFGLRVLNIRAVKNSGSGIYLRSSGALIRGNSVFENGHYGILTDSGGLVVDNTVHHNVSDGIYALSGSSVIGNTVFANTQNGINGSNGCTVTGNSVYQNGKCGLRVGRGSTITGNTIKDNNQTESTDSMETGGLWVFYQSIVKGNTMEGNKVHNMYVYGRANAIEENLMAGSPGNGLYFSEGGNFYANNRASGNSANYVNAAGNVNGGGNYSF